MILDGKKQSAELLSELKAVVAKRGDVRAPRFGVLLVGDDYASHRYVDMKAAAAQSCGVVCDVVKLPNTSDKEIAELVTSWSSDDDMDGLMIQLPLPSPHISEEFTTLIRTDKDIDGLNPHSLGLYFSTGKGFLSATPKGIITLLDRYQVPISGQHVVIIGRSSIVGKPLAAGMLNRDATVTVAHSKSRNIENLVSTADIVVAAVGKPRLFSSKLLKDGAVLIDAGFSSDQEEGRPCGDFDVDLDDTNRLLAYTPVPGGVGPMTIASLLENCVDSWRDRLGTV